MQAAKSEKGGGFWAAGKAAHNGLHIVLQGAGFLGLTVWRAYTVTPAGGLRFRVRLEGLGLEVRVQGSELWAQSLELKAIRFEG